MDFSVGLYVALLLILAAEFVNGWTDAPNAIATVVSTKTLSPRLAVLLATLLNIAGAFYGKAVAVTIGKNIVRPEAIDLITVSAAMIAIVLWSTTAWYFEIPTSESHALIAGLSGAALAVAGPSSLLWAGWSKAMIGLFFSTVLGYLGGWVLAKFVQLIFANFPPAPTRKGFGLAQIFSSMLMAFSHGSNDGQKFMGAFALALLLGGATDSFALPFWVIILCALVMGAGTSLGGMRIIKTMGFKIAKNMETYQGFSAEAAASATILAASSFGIPLSTTHTINTSIVGVGLARGKSAVDWDMVLKVVAAWILTFPACGLIAFISAKLLYLFFR